MPNLGQGLGAVWSRLWVCSCPRPRLLSLPVAIRRHHKTLRLTQLIRTLSHSLNMSRSRKEKKAKDIKLRQPDRSGPTEKTLLQIAEDQNLFNLAAKEQRKSKGPGQRDGDGDASGDEDGLSLSADRLLDTLLYTVCLAMLHFTLDFLVQHQYAMEIDYKKITERAFQALMGSSPHHPFELF